MNEQTTHRVAVVTGGTGAIGTAICHALANDGLQVVAIGHPSEAQRMADWQATMDDAAGSGRVDHRLVELTDASATAAALTDIVDALGRVDALVNAAGITRDAPLKRMELDDWRAVMATNLDTVFHVTRPLIERMIAAEAGRIVNIASINGQKGQFGQTNYSAAKAGMHGFTMALAQEVARYGITVNTVSPGYVDSPMIQAVPETVRERILTSIPAGRFARPEEIADTVAFLCRPQAAYITGANIPVNGGQFMH